ncbi:tripartite tricarboxylate transporter substrate binding protein [Hydrogenophaga sp. ANAO-22]|jgi:tripartite-type tricarboxylate transporter receptor subunit TctC|uniref:tripartite tricarboxylate transporter substrate binding protein n=1 Tax=Hydrogenophaga sp. ANAO-22 TaxID=3166645 RepID=UPI0036D3832B
MTTSRSRRSLVLRTTLIAGAGLLAAGLTHAQARYPSKPIEVIVPWPAGTSADVGMRTVSQALSKQLRVPVQVINKPGGQAVIGTAEFVKAHPDGYTLGSINIGPAVSQVIAGNAPYTMADMTPIGIYNVLPFVVATKTDAPFKTMKELAAHAKASGKDVILGNFGPGAVPTQTVVRMAGTDGWKAKLVAFPSPGYTQLNAGDADVVTVESINIMGQVKAGNARVLVTMTPKRLPAFPDVPTVKELGYGFDVSIWTGLFAPKGTPPEIVQTLAKALEAALQDPGVKAYAEKSGTFFDHMSPEQTAALIQQDTAWLRPVMESLGLVKK